MKKNILKQTLTALLITISICSTFAQQWKRVGNQFGTTPSGTLYYSPASVFSPNSNTYYTAFVNASSQLIVMKYDANKTWTQVGTISAKVTFTAPSLAINPLTDEPYVSYIDNKYGTYVVQKFTANAWQEVGTIPDGALANYLPVIKFIPGSDKLFIAFINGGNNNDVVVKQYDNVNWNTVGNTIGNATNTLPNSYIQHHSCSLAFNPSTNEPYVAFINAGGFLTLKKLSNSNNTWQDVVSLNNKKAETISTNALAFNPISSLPCVAFSILNTSGYLKAQVFSIRTIKASITWLDMKSDSLATGATAPELAFVPNAETMYVTGFAPAGGVFNVSKYTGTTWTLLGSQLCTNQPNCIGPSCGYNNSYQTASLIFNTITNKACLSYAVQLANNMFEFRVEP